MWFAVFALGLCCCLPSLAQEVIRGPVTIYDTTYERVDEGPPLVEAPRQEEQWQPADPTPAERTAGFIPFTRPEPFDIKPWSKPKPQERATELHCYAAQGETTALWFAVYAIETLNGLDIRVASAPAQQSSAAALTVRYAHYWAQRTDWRGRTYTITPELLLEMRSGRARFPARGGTLEWRPLNVPQGECRLFWINVKVSPDATPGNHLHTLTIRAQGKEPLSLQVRVHVQPFRLQKPTDKRWLLYSDSWVLGHLPDEKLLQLLKEVAEYGIDGLTELPFGNLDLSAIAEGKVGYDPQPLLRWHRLMREAGLRGPHTIGTFIEEEVARRLGLQVDWSQPWDDRLRRAMQTIARTVVQTLQPHGLVWLFYGWDEPGPENVRALEQYRAWREGGARTYVTFFQQGTYDRAGEWMTHPCFSVGLVANQQMAEWAYERCRERGQRFYWYGSGCYLGQEGRMFSNRFLAGWLFWKTKADGQVSWTFVRPHEDPFNDFDGFAVNNVEPKDQCTVYPEFAQPDDYRSIQGIIPTIQWEALREGINDYRYLHTLRNIIAYARSVATNPEGNTHHRRLLEAARQCEETLKAVEASVPWLSEAGRAGFTNANLQEARTLIGLATTRLVRLLKGERVQSATRPQSVTLKVRIVEPSSYPISTSYLPLLTLPRWNQPPRVDGNLDEPQWRTAALASSFTESQSGAPIPESLLTEARLAVDDSALYLGFVCRALHPDRLVVDRRGRDADGIWLDEGIEIFLASPDVPERYAHFIINAGGFIYDELGFDSSWNAGIQVATRITEEGWTAEIAIPWRPLPFAVNLDEVGKPLLRLNLGRNHAERGRVGVSHWAWSPTFGWFHNPQRFGTAMLATNGLVVTRLVLPVYVDDEPARLTLANTGEQAKVVEVTGQQVTIPPKGEETLTLPSSTEPGEHTCDVAIRWQGGSLQFPVVYTVPQPLQMVQRAVLASGTEVEVPVAVALRSPKNWVLSVHADHAQTTRTRTETVSDFQVRLRQITSDTVRLRLELSNSQRYADDVVLFLPPR